LLNLAEYVGEENGGGRIQLRHKISQGDLAAMAGVARENVSRTMSEWRKRDVVTRSSDYTASTTREHWRWIWSSTANACA
jgi:CRP-like cAMP-binding protein